MSCWISSGASKPNAARLPIFSDDFLAVFFHLLGASQHRATNVVADVVRGFFDLRMGCIGVKSGLVLATHAPAGYAVRGALAALARRAVTITLLSGARGRRFCGAAAYARVKVELIILPQNRLVQRNESAHHSVTLRQTRAGQCAHRPLKDSERMKLHLHTSPLNLVTSMATAIWTNQTRYNEMLITP